jgi:hypothetical protein
LSAASSHHHVQRFFELFLNVDVFVNREVGAFLFRGRWRVLSEKL